MFFGNLCHGRNPNSGRYGGQVRISAIEIRISCLLPEARIEIFRLENALIVPSAAVFREGTDWAIYEFKNGLAIKHKANVVRRSGQEAAIESDLAHETDVIEFPSASLREGSAVSPRT